MTKAVTNPFAPEFGPPPIFFGRYRYTELFGAALRPGPQANRALLVEGVRGMGKTALLSHFLAMGQAAGWDTRYYTSLGLANELVHDFSAQGGPRPSEVSLKLGPVSGSVELEEGSEGWSVTPRQPILDHLRKRGRGLLLLVDEVQKLLAGDAQLVCDAMNAARMEGHDVALVMAGLPGTRRRIASFPHCTYMARSTHVELGLMPVAEVRDALEECFGRVPWLRVSPELREAVAAWSQGHPYLIQLVGYSLFDQAARARAGRRGVEVTEPMLTEARDFAYHAYADDVLSFVFAKVGLGAKSYLRALASTMGPNGAMASGGAVAELAHMPPERAAVYRQRMLMAGILVAPARGVLRFAIPYVPRYLSEELPLARAREDEEFYPVT